MAPPPGEPSRDLVRRQRRRQRPDLGPAGKKRLLDVPILGPEQPVGVALDDDVTELLEPSGGTRRRAGAKRRTEALVGVLVAVESRQKLDIVVHQRFGNGAAVIGKGAIERQPSRRHLDDKTIEPFGRNKIEQRRCRHEIHWTVQHAFEIVREIDRRGGDGQVWWTSGWGGSRQKTEVVVDQIPALARGKMRPQCPQHRAGAASEIDHGDCRLPNESAGNALEHHGVARGDIIGFAQCQPLCGVLAHPTLSRTRANKAACCGHDGKMAARAPAARRSRSAGFSMSRCNAAASASMSSGATSTPAEAGTVSGIAPAVVPTTGTPWRWPLYRPCRNLRTS